MSVRWQDIQLIETCGACPEQYDALYDGKDVGYLRLRHGHFYVECPNIGGKTVYAADPEGDGCFVEEEREYYLTSARQAIANWCNSQGIEPDLGSED
ncbi:hypothetical protein D3C86_1477750 [compost metagenome]